MLGLAFDLIKDSLARKYVITGKTHWDVDDPMEERCNLPLDYTFSILRAFEVEDDTGTARQILMLRDPVDGDSNLVGGPYTGAWDTAAFLALAD